MPKKLKRKSASMRAYTSKHGSLKKTGQSKKTAKAIGKSIRQSRLREGVNPNTGKTLSAKKAGLKGAGKKAYKALSKPAKRGVTAKSTTFSQKKGKNVGASSLKGQRKVLRKTYSSGPTAKTKTVARIAKKQGISRSAANKVRKSR